MFQQPQWQLFLSVSTILVSYNEFTWIELCWYALYQKYSSDSQVGFALFEVSLNTEIPLPLQGAFSLFGVLLSLATRSFGADATLKFQNLANWVNNSGGYVPGLAMAWVLFCSRSWFTLNKLKISNCWTAGPSWFNTCVFYSIELPSWNLTEIPKIAMFERRYMFQTIMFGTLDFGGCKSWFSAQVSPKLRYIDGTVKGAMLLAAEKIRSGERLLHIPSSLQISDAPWQCFCFHAQRILGNHLGNCFLYGSYTECFLWRMEVLLEEWSILQFSTHIHDIQSSIYRIVYIYTCFALIDWLMEWIGFDLMWLFDWVSYCTPKSYPSKKQKMDLQFKETSTSCTVPELFSWAFWWIE